MSDTKRRPPAADPGTAAGEPVLRLDNKVYDDLAAFVSGARTDTGAADLSGADRERVEAFLYREARLLDMGHYRAWIELLAPDFIYWIPTSADASDARTGGSVNFDDRRRMIDRVTLIETSVQWAQVPRSRVCRALNNIEVFSGTAGAVRVRSVVTVWEYRARHTQCFVGWQAHELVPAGNGFLVRRKIIGLLDCDQPQGNTTFIL
jgi:3-phenylpropionate/cinnamic acid dioxygenase small subunit